MINVSAYCEKIWCIAVVVLDQKSTYTTISRAIKFKCATVIHQNLDTGKVSKTFFFVEKKSCYHGNNTFPS